jgi:hypothetical protein
MDLFTPVADQAKLHPNFRATLASSSASVRAVLTDWASDFVDRDGKFVYEFQTTYNSSFWELYLFAVLKHLGIKVDFSFPSPDFLAADMPLAIEATIASHAQDDVPEWEKTIKGITHDNLAQAYVQSIIRLSNAFHGKVSSYSKKYAALPYMADRAYGIAISNYGTQDFNMLGDVAMQRLLYDVWEEEQVYKKNGSGVRVGLFRSDAYSHVSAVIYSAVATFGKARALSAETGDFVFNAIRIRDNYEPINIVARKSEYKESLTDGLRLFTNPYARVPVDLRPFEDPGVRCFLAQKDGSIAVSCHPDGDLCMRMVHQLVTRS